MKVKLNSKFKNPVSINYKPYKTMLIEPNKIYDLSEQVINNYGNMFTDEFEETSIPLFDDSNVIVETEELNDNIIDDLFLEESEENIKPKRKK